LQRYIRQERFQGIRVVTLKRLQKDDKPAMPADVASAFEAFPAAIRDRLLTVRRPLFQIAAETGGVGPVTETLKMGRAGLFDVRERQRQYHPTGPGVLVARSLRRAVHWPHDAGRELPQPIRRCFRLRENRALLLNPTAPLPETELSICLRRALTYHRCGGALLCSAERGFMP
jgi:hypothetical protein